MSEPQPIQEMSNSTDPAKVPMKPFEEPKLTYVAPKLNKHGKVEQVTQSFFGSFSP